MCSMAGKWVRRHLRLHTTQNKVWSSGCAHGGSRQAFAASVSVQCHTGLAQVQGNPKILYEELPALHACAGARCMPVSTLTAAGS